jgi:hypothetical protein
MMSTLVFENLILLEIHTYPYKFQFELHLLRCIQNVDNHQIVI